jgi:hypothetical protein
MHADTSPLAGQIVRIKSHVTHPQQPSFGGMEFRVEDWWDRLAGKSWGLCDGNPACLIYALRIGFAKHHVDADDEVLYGHGPGGLGHLVHLSEIELGARGGEK